MSIRVSNVATKSITLPFCTQKNTCKSNTNLKKSLTIQNLNFKPEFSNESRTL